MCDAIMNAAMLLICKETPTINIQSTALPASMLTFSPVQAIYIHHNGKGHFVSSSLTNKVKICDSLNTKPMTELLEQITGIHSCDSTIPEILQVNLPAYQNGSVDCELFAIAYATDLATGNNPAEIIYDQCEMRNLLLNCLHSRSNIFQDSRKENRLMKLNSFIEKVLFELNESMKKHKSKFVNNLIPKQRIVLQSVAKNKNIIIIYIIVPSDKVGSIVILDKEGYDKACLDILVTNYYEELNENPNTSWRNLKRKI